jgi:plasmid maintenance system antidote protein VapI
MIARIKHIIDYYEHTTRSFEQKISVSDGTIRKFLCGKISLKVDTILKISANFPQISLDWLLLNKGEMFRKTEEKPPENIQISNCQYRTVQNNFAKNTTAEPSTEYGNFHATIEALQSTIEAQQHTIEAQQKLIGSLERHIESLERQLSE